MAFQDSYDAGSSRSGIQVINGRIAKPAIGVPGGNNKTRIITVTTFSGLQPSVHHGSQPFRRRCVRTQNTSFQLHRKFLTISQCVKCKIIAVAGEHVHWQLLLFQLIDFGKVRSKHTLGCQMGAMRLPSTRVPRRQKKVPDHTERALTPANIAHRRCKQQSPW